MELTEHYCWKCKQTKTTDEFHYDRTRKEGVSKVCKKCRQSLNKDLRKRERLKNILDQLDGYDTAIDDIKKELIKRGHGIP